MQAFLIHAKIHEKERGSEHPIDLTRAILEQVTRTLKIAPRLVSDVVNDSLIKSRTNPISEREFFSRGDIVGDNGD